MRLAGDGVTVDRGERRVLDGLSFWVSAGEALAVTGPNGAGKSTLLRAIAGLAPLAAGSIVLEPAHSAAVHWIGHLDGVKGQLTVRDNALFWRRWLAAHGPGGAAAEAVVEAALESVGLAHLAELPAGFLSQGQRRRLALARLLLDRRPLWLLDEPTAGLDAASRRRFSALLAEHLAGGGLVVAATHEPLAVVGTRELTLAAGPGRA